MASVPFWLCDLAGAWVFYSVLPAWPWLQPGFRRIARFAPWIGLVIGVLAGLLWVLLEQLGWPTASRVLVVLGFEAWITGGLHHDDCTLRILEPPDEFTDDLLSGFIDRQRLLAISQYKVQFGFGDINPNDLRKRKCVFHHLCPILVNTSSRRSGSSDGSGS